MAPVQADHDYYAVLEISNTATLEVVTKSYRRLAKLHHPDKNLDNHSSTAAFQNLLNAYETIKDADKRRVYDLKWPSIREKLRSQHESEIHKAEAEEREQRRASQERAEEKGAEEARQERLRHLEVLKRRHTDDIFEVDRAVRKLTAELTRLQDKDDEDLRKRRQQNSWWAYLASPIYGQPKETEDQKMTREAERIQRLAAKRIKDSELKEKETKLSRLRDSLRIVNENIAAEKEKAEDAFQTQVREENRRKEQEARMKAEREKRERWERWEESCVRAQKERAEREAKKARDAEAERKAREEQERLRKAERDKLEAEHARKRQEEQEKIHKARAERHQKLAEERIRATHAAEETARKAQAASTYASSHAPDSRRSNCKHEKFWPKLEGRHQCDNCHAFQNRFAFQCPGCEMIACANCRQDLRGRSRPKRV